MERKQVFDGIKVVEFTVAATGPQVGRELAEHGATVIRVECHRSPDAARTNFPFKDGVPGIDRSAFATAFNTNKYGISLDLNLPKGRDVAKKLVKWADVFIESMSPGMMARWGLDYENCTKIKSDMIYCSTCQMGQKGPLAKFKGYGILGATYAGFANLTGWPDRGPLPLFNNHSDLVAPGFMIVTLISALLRRRKTGKGIYLDQSQVEAGAAFLGPQILDYMVNGQVAGRMGNRDRTMVPHSLYPCKDVDRWVAIAVTNEHEWKALCKEMGDPEWSRDPEFSTLSARKKNEEKLDSLIGEWTKAYHAEEIMERLQAAGVPCGKVQTAEDLFNDPQLKHREHFRFLEHPVIGKHAYHAPAYKLSKTPNHIRKAGPCLGGDNEYVYKNILGYSDDEISDMMAEGVITTEWDVPT